MKALQTFLFIFSLEAIASQTTTTTTPTTNTTTTTPSVQLCPDDWFDADSLGCFKFLDSKVNLSWVEAQLTCEQAGGYLAEPRTESQAKFLSEVAILEGSFTGIGYWYIGLTDLGREGDWLWIHNEEHLTDASWGPNHPIDHPKNEEDCAVMVLKNNQVWWEDHNCLSPDVKHHDVAPVCQQDTTASQTQTTTEQPETTAAVSCPDQWTEFNNGCYQHVSANVFWPDADLSCFTKGGRLTSVHSDDEDVFLQSLASGNSYWIGGYPVASNWIWSDETDFDYSNDYSATKGYCLFQSSSYYGYGWSSDYCSGNNRYNYICKLNN